MVRAALSDEQDLLNRLREGDAEAFTTLYDRYWRKLFVAATNKLKDAAVAKDASVIKYIDTPSGTKDIAADEGCTALGPEKVKGPVFWDNRTSLNQPKPIRIRANAVPILQFMREIGRNFVSFSGMVASA